MWKVRWSTWHKRGTKKKIWVPDTNRTHDLHKTGLALYPLSYEHSLRARSFNWVSWMLLESALLKSSLVLQVNRDGAEFKLSNEMWKSELIITTRVYEKEKSEIRFSPEMTKLNGSKMWLLCICKWNNIKLQLSLPNSIPSSRCYVVLRGINYFYVLKVIIDT